MLQKFGWKNVSEDKAIAASIAVGLVILVASVATSPSSIEPNRADGSVAAKVVDRETKAAIAQHLGWADEEGDAAVGQEVLAVVRYFDDARANTRDFAEETLGFSSKLRMFGDFFTNSGDHPRFVRERFESMVLSQPQLDQVIRGTISSYLRRLDDIDSQLLVLIKADVENVPTDTFSTAPDLSSVDLQLGAALQDTINATQQELVAGVGVELVSYVAGEVASQAVKQLGASTGLMSQDDADGLAGRALGLGVELAVDKAVNDLYTQSFDPIGKLSETLCSRLSDIERSIIRGTPQSVGVIDALFGLSEKRKTARRTAIEQALHIQLP